MSRRVPHTFRFKGFKKLIEDLGGTVDIFRIGREGHGGFNHNARYQLEAVELWDRLCEARRNAKDSE